LDNSEDNIQSEKSAFSSYSKQDRRFSDLSKNCDIDSNTIKIYNINPKNHQNKCDVVEGENLSCENQVKYNSQSNSNQIPNLGEFVSYKDSDNKRGETSLDNCDNESSKSKSSTTKSNFKLRTDVVNKTILRAFKKYYTMEFKAFYDFSKIRKTCINTEEFLTKADEFVTKHMGESKFGDMNVFLASIVDSKQKHSKANAKYEKLKSQVNSLLYSFNKKKVEALLSYPEFSILLLNFLSQPSITYEICKCKKNSDISDKDRLTCEEEDTLKVYNRQVKVLRER